MDIVLELIVIQKILAKADEKIDALLKHETQMVLTLEGLRREAEYLGADASMFADQSLVDILTAGGVEDEEVRIIFHSEGIHSEMSEG